jgi:C4-dicarboxylate transporter, DctM subunit
MTIFSTLAFILAGLIGTPLFVVLGGLALFLFHLVDTPFSTVAIEIYEVANAPTLLTIPLFTFAGYLLAESKSPKRLLRLADITLGRLPGGVAIAGLVLCAFFTAFTGASGVTIIALGGLLYPILTKEGYSEDFSLGLLTTCGSLGLLFPPSLPIILYGLVAKVDIDQLFIAGLLPGFFLISVLSAWAIYKGRFSLMKKREVAAFSWKEFWDAFKGCIPELLLPIGVLWSIYGGVATVSETAALTAWYILLIEVFWYRDLTLTKDIPRLTIESMSLVGGILLILCCALGLTNFLVDEEIPLKIFAFIREVITDKYTFLLCLNIFLLVVGCLMDIFSAIVVVVPIIVPIAAEYGIHPVHLAMIFLTNLEIGYITPPVGINLFISSFRFNKPVLQLYRSVLPFLIILLAALMVITYVPELSLMFVTVD